MESIWSQETEFPQRQPLDNTLETDAVVIGGGMAGILTAWYLQRRGIATVVLEANRVGSGQTENTTAKITSQHDLIYDKLLRTFGRERAQQYARANQAAIEAYRTIVQEKQIDCDLETVPAFLYSKTDETALKREADAARQLGISASYTTETTLPFAIRGAVRFENQAQFHPLKFLKSIAEELTIYEHTSVQQVCDHTLETNRGRVQAKHIVFATHYPFVNFPGLYFARMHQERSYVVALQGAQKLDGVYLGIDPNSLSFRNAGELLLLGGEGHRTGANLTANPYENLLRNGRRWYPGCQEVARWSAQDCITMDGVPYIGRYAPSRPDWYVATGFQKWGMTSAMVSAMLLSDLICGVENENAAVFSPRRFLFRASAKTLMTDVGASTKGLAKGAVGIPSRTLESLPNGHGGIVRVNGKKAGAYKDEQGKVYLVSPRCPHLGCQLEWNAAERSWDCPCHGSRFDYEGRLLSGPAQKDIGLE